MGTLDHDDPPEEDPGPLDGKRKGPAPRRETPVSTAEPGRDRRKEGGGVGVPLVTHEVHRRLRVLGVVGPD